MLLQARQFVIAGFKHAFLMLQGWVWVFVVLFYTLYNNYVAFITGGLEKSDSNTKLEFILLWHGVTKVTPHSPMISILNLRLNKWGKVSF